MPNTFPLLLKDGKSFYAIFLPSTKLRLTAKPFRFGVKKKENPISDKSVEVELISIYL